MGPVELGHVTVGEGPTPVAVHGGLLAGRLISFGALVALTALQLERRLFASVTVIEAPAVTLAGADADVREAYRAHKRRLAARHPEDREGCTEAKADFVTTALARR